MFTKTTHGMKITVLPQYIPGQSQPAEDFYVWAYTITMENHGGQPMHLLNRYWHITDGQGRVQEVRGPGVVGEQPVLKPGSTYRYSSGTHLPTPSGIMRGTYQFARQDGEMLDVTIPAFSLDSPEQIARPN